MKTIKPSYFLLMGIATVAISQLNISIDVIGWISFVPFLMYLRMTQGLRSRSFFILALFLGWSVCISKIVSPPMPFAMVFLYSFPICIFQLPGFLIWDRYKVHNWSPLLFSAIMTTMEWIQYTFTPLASWGVAAYSQSHTLSMMQVVSLGGMPLLSFIIYWVNVSVADVLVRKEKSLITWHLPITVTLVLMVFGALRYDLSKINGKETIKVAAVGTDSEMTGFPLPSKQTNDNVKVQLVNRTRRAASCGAKLIVWNEASTFIFQDEEKAWTDSLSTLASRLQVAIVAAYIIPISESPMQYKNKYLFFDSTGTLVYSYNKHQPVPGEPAAKGEEPFRVFNVAGVATGAAICYDYDFPYIAKSFGALQADIVAVPSSDWRGIDPIHTKMAAFRAVEQGHAILRSTRFGLSAAITPYGEMVSQMSSYDKNDRIMITNLPSKHITTVYSIIGDVFVYLCIGFVFWFLLNIALSGRKIASTNIK